MNKISYSKDLDALLMELSNEAIADNGHQKWEDA
jgi:hypothetical protein